jgi:hypothetical protein
MLFSLVDLSRLLPDSETLLEREVIFLVFVLQWTLCGMCFYQHIIFFALKQISMLLNTRMQMHARNKIASMVLD